MALDVLFVNPPSPDDWVYIRDINRSGRRTREGTIWPQTSLAYLAAVMKRAGYSVALVDCIALDIDWRHFRELLEEKKPRYVVINVISSIVVNDLQTSYLARSLGAKSIALGPHLTELPAETMERFPTLDYGIIGEAEESVLELIQTDEAGGDLSKVKGIVYRDGVKPVVTEKRPFIEDLDSLPIPLHELLPIDRHRQPFIGKRYTFVLHSRGCPFKCTFCRQIVMWKGNVRVRSAGSIFEELKYLKKIGVDNIMFHSDTFTIDKKQVIALCRMIVDSGMKVRWICNSRVDTVDEEMLGWMKKAGCWMINYGIETASDEILKNVRKGATVEQARKACAWTKAAGIRIWGYFIIGLPGETKETIEQTIALAKELPLSLCNFAVGAPYPGTEFHRQAKAEGWLDSEDWEDFDQNYSAIVSTPTLSAKQVMEGIQHCYRSYYLRPRGIWIMLKAFFSMPDFGFLWRLGMRHLHITREKC